MAHEAREGGGVMADMPAPPINTPIQDANGNITPAVAKAPWYFLGLQEMVSYSAFWGGVGIPTIFVLLLLD